MNTPVSFAIAKLLKEKEFDKETNDYFLEDGIEYSYPKKENWNLKIDTISQPTIADVVMWLYDKHNIYIHISPHADDDETEIKHCKWWFSVYKDKVYNLMGGSKVTKGIDEYNTRTEAYKAAIKHCLENLIK